MAKPKQIGIHYNAWQPYANISDPLVSKVLKCSVTRKQQSLVFDFDEGKVICKFTWEKKPHTKRKEKTMPKKKTKPKKSKKWPKY